MKKEALHYKELEKNQFFYDYFFVKKIFNIRKFIDDNEIVERIKYLAEFAYFHHTGFFSDERIENILVSYGQNLNQYISNYHKEHVEIVNYNMPTIIHVASIIAEVGGHTRILSQMISRIKGKNQVLFLTSQQVNDIPKWFKEKHSSNLKILTFESFDHTESYFDKAIILRRISLNCEKVILYHHPYDVIPVIAFGDKDSPTVLLENHAHTWFWFGSSIADIVFSHTVFHTEFTTKYRTVRNSIYLPFSQLPDQKNVFDFNDKINAKKRLSIDNETICITAIGTIQKFFPISDKYNFFRLINRLINRFDNVVIIVVGIDNTFKDINRYSIDKDKVRFVGYQSDLTDYYLASDISIDSIPEPSLGATIFANFVGMSCPLFKYGGSGVFDAINMFPNEKYEQHIGKPETETEYLEKIELLIADSELRIEIAESFRISLINEINGDALEKKCNELFAFAGTLKHKSSLLPKQQIFFDAWGEEIANANTITIYDSILYFNKYLSSVDIVRVLIHFCSLSEYRSDSIWAIKRLAERKRFYRRLGRVLSKFSRFFNFNKFKTAVH